MKELSLYKHLQKIYFKNHILTFSFETTKAKKHITINIKLVKDLI